MTCVDVFMTSGVLRYSVTVMVTATLSVTGYSQETAVPFKSKGVIVE